MNKTGMREPTDYTAHKWEITEGVEGYDLKAKFYPDEDCFICYREIKEYADMSIYVKGNNQEFRLPTNIFRKVINEVISFVGFKNNVLIPKIEF